MKVAIAHEWLTNMGGAENVVLNFKEIFKNADVYTSVLNYSNIDPQFKDMNIHTSFINSFYKAKTKYRTYLPFMPTAWEQFDFNAYDIVLSSSHCCAKGIITPPNTMHVCYCHTPMRYAWEFYNEYLKEHNVGNLKLLLIRYIMNYIRTWDLVSAKRVDYFIANSQNVAKRIWKHYRREADVIHPPVKGSFFNISDFDEDYFLIVSRLVPYKRVDIAVQAFNELRLPLVVIGGGPQLDSLRDMAKDNVKILGRQSDDVIREYYQKCRALIFPGEEDFGITPLEAQASGRPVIAYGQGGALETVKEYETGLFFYEQTVDSLKQSIKQFESLTFNKYRIRMHALQFDEEIFKVKIENYILEKYMEFKEKNSVIGKLYEIG